MRAKLSSVSCFLLLVSASSLSAQTAARPKPGSTAIVHHEAGIYAAMDDQVVPLEPSTFRQDRVGGKFGLIGVVMSDGIMKAKFKAMLSGSRASLRVPTPCSFDFYFDGNNAGTFAGVAQAATSPNDFVLLRLSRQRKDRSVVIGEYGLSSGISAGTRGEDTIAFSVESTGHGHYRVVPASKLEPGEYAFYYAAGSPQLGTNTPGKLFDFGVD